MRAVRTQLITRIRFSVKKPFNGKTPAREEASKTRIWTAIQIPVAIRRMVTNTSIADETPNPDRIAAEIAAIARGKILINRDGVVIWDKKKAAITV